MKGIIALLALLIGMKAMAQQALLPTEAEKRKIAEAVSEASSSSTHDGKALMNEDAIKNMTGVEEFASAANFGGSDTLLSIKRQSTVELSCSLPSISQTAGIKLEAVSCNASAGNLNLFTLNWCEIRDGVNCTNPPAEISIAQGVTLPMGEGEIELIGCQLIGADLHRCEFRMVSLIKDSFDGSDGNLQQEANQRENDNPSFFLDSLESSINNPRYAEMETEAQGSADYVQGAYESLNEDGEFPVYRNSPEDIAQFGVRDAVIGIPMATPDPAANCSSGPMVVESCTSNYNLTEYVCTKPEETLCEFVRNKKEEVCTEKLNVTCGSKLACGPLNTASELPIKNVRLGGTVIHFTDIQDTYPCPSGSSDCRNVTFPGKQIDFSYPDLYYKMASAREIGWTLAVERMFFEINDLDNINSLIVERVNIDDAGGIWVNDNLVFHAYEGKISHTRADSEIRWVRNRSRRRGDNALQWQNGNKSRSDYGHSSYPNVDLDIKPWLKEGTNTIKFTLGVIGSGWFDINMKVDGYCGCALNEETVETCSATNIVN